jgi:RNA-binding protein
MEPLTNAQIRKLKAQAQRLKATIKIGKEGLSPQFLAALDEVLKHHELVKVKFDEFKEQKKELTPELAQRTKSYLITRVGNVVALYRPKAKEKRGSKNTLANERDTQMRGDFDLDARTRESPSCG